MDILREKLEESFLLRWVLANVFGWTIGLVAGGYIIRLPDLPAFCLPLICLIGAFAGICIGAAQWYILRPVYPVERRWIFLSSLGVALASVPAYFLGLSIFLVGIVGVSLLNNLAVILAGALVGAGAGIAQSGALEKQLRGSTRWWIAACALAGGICGLLSFLPILPPLPIGILTGTALYGYITGRTLLWLSRENEP